MCIASHRGRFQHQRLVFVSIICTHRNQVENAAKYARPLKTHNPKAKPCPHSKEAEGSDEKSYCRRHSCVDCERQRDSNSVRQEAERGCGSAVNAETRSLSDGQSRQVRGRTLNSVS